MSTRSNLDFYREKPTNDNKNVARLYHHSDGYPSERLKNIKSAYDLAVKHYTNGRGYDYRVKELAGYITDLAAFYVLANKVWTSFDGVENAAGGLEIDSGELHGDIEYYYQIWADEDGTLMVRILNPSSVMDEGTLDDLMLRHC